jgi:hypothetical protein
LRELVDVLDRVDQHEDYDPAVHYRLDLREDTGLTPEELAGRHGTGSTVAATTPPESPRRGARTRRLDG